ncbi:MAG: WYL domain-containing protein [Cryomorphaceae bacterium]|nr:WYL domain-containing protein [Cryomorphaceae bacterium]
MTIRETILRHRLIIGKLRRFPQSFDEIADFLASESRLQSADFNISQRTFQRDIKDIESIYQIEVKFDRKLARYYIAADYNDDAKDRIFEAFDTLNALNLTDRLSAHIHFQKRTPTGTEHLYALIQAIKSQVEVSFEHFKYYDDAPTERRLDPLGLKEYRNRWYLVGRDHKDGKVKTFGLDRMVKLEVTRRKFERLEGFSLDDYFQYSWGVIVGGSERPKAVELRFSPFQGKYIKSLPLHPSQEILIDDKNEVRVRLFVHPTYDFVMEILSMIPEVEVLKPKSLVDEVRRRVSRYRG